MDRNKAATIAKLRRGLQVCIEQDELRHTQRAAMAQTQQRALARTTATAGQPDSASLQRWRTAAHEAGHLVGVFDSRARATGATIMRRGEQLGSVFFKFDEGGEDESFARMVLSVIGRCAEEKCGFDDTELDGSDLESFCEFAGAACRQTGGAVSLDRIRQWELAARSYADRLLNTFEEKFFRLQGLLCQHGSLSEPQIYAVLDDWS